MNDLLGIKIKTLRKNKRISMEELGKLTGVSKTYIWELEHSESSNPTANKILKISQALGVTLDYLLNDDLNPSSDVIKDAFFIKFNKMKICDQNRIVKIIDAWGIDE